MLFSDMKCFTCGKPPEKVTLAKGQRLDLTSFYSSKEGLLNPRSYEGYDIHLCDSCLIEGGRQGRVTRSVTEQRPPNIYEYIWNPDGDDKSYAYPPPVFYSLKEKAEDDQRSD